MATEQSTVDYITDCLARAGTIRTRKMFGEYALYKDDRVVALICDNQLFIKPTSASEGFKDECEAAPAYPGSKDYLLVPEEKWEDREWLCNFVTATAEQVPPPKPKKK